MHSIVRQAKAGVVAPARMIWLPGAYQEPEDFLRAGFDTAVRTLGLDLDLQFVGLELEHVGDRKMIAELAGAIVAPARAAGCGSIWLAGISLGGFFALDYAATETERCDGLYVLAPYLGNRQLIAEVAAAPCLEDWQPGLLADDDEERRIWRYIRDRRRDDGGAPLYLGYGREDRFARGHALMADALAPDSVDVADGGHDWPTWRALWERFLASNFS